MFRKRFVISVLLLLAALTLAGCAKTSRINDVSGKTFVYEKDGFPNEFGITLNSDGSFTYYEGFYSSYVGMGSWELDGDTLILRDETTNFQDPHKTKKTLRVNRFKVSDGLVFLSDGSDNFIYVKVADGERFLCSEEDLGVLYK